MRLGELGYALSVWASGRDNREDRVAFVEQTQELAQLGPVACHRNRAACKQLRTVALAQ